MVEKFLSINPDDMEAGTFYSVFTNQDNATLVIPKAFQDGINDTVADHTLDIIELKTPVNQCWVSPDGSDNNEGSISFPFKTIQKALDGLYDCININSGTYNENLNIPVGYGQYACVISGTGTFESPKTFIRGKITIPSGVSRVRIKNLMLDGKGTDSAIYDNGSDGRHVLENVTVSNAGVSNDLIQVVNGKNWWNVTNSTIEGIINLSGTGVAAMFNLINCPNSFICMPVINTGYTFTAFYVAKMGMITHHGGNVVCSYVGSWYPVLGKIINSTSTSISDFIGVGYSNFSPDGSTYGTISSTGATVLKNFNAESLYGDVCLSAVSILNTTIGTTAQTLKAEVKKVERNISYSTSSGELTFNKTGSYNIGIIVKIDCSEWDKKVELWIEKYNGSTWDIVSETGFIRKFQTDQEVEVRYDLASYFLSGEKYRLRAVSDSATAIVASTQTLTNGVKMPAIRLSIYA